MNKPQIKILKHWDEERLIDQIEDALKQGYTFQGSMVVTVRSSGAAREYYQMMIKQ